MASGLVSTSVAQSGTNNGTATPATPGSLTTTAGNLLILVIAALGTSPTIATPASWTQIQKVSGTALSVAMYALPNNAGGATNPSSTLGGTVTGWIANMYEFVTGSSSNVIASVNKTAAVAQLTNVFSTFLGAVGPRQMYVYAVARATATITTANTVLNWSSSVQGVAGVQGLSLDLYWADTLYQDGQAYSGFPSCSGLLSGAVNSVQIGAVVNCSCTENTSQTNVGGFSGLYVPPFYQGTIGG